MNLGAREILVVLALLGACIVVPAVVALIVVLVRKPGAGKDGA